MRLYSCQYCAIRVRNYVVWISVQKSGCNSDIFCTSVYTVVLSSRRMLNSLYTWKNNQMNNVQRAYVYASFLRIIYF